MELDEASIDSIVDGVISSNFSVGDLAATLSVSADLPFLIGSSTFVSFFVLPFSADCFESKIFPSPKTLSEALTSVSLPLSVAVAVVVVVIDVDGAASSFLSSSSAVLLPSVSVRAGSSAAARSRVEEVAGAPALDLFRFVVLEDDIVVVYFNAVVIMCIFYRL